MGQQKSKSKAPAYKASSPSTYEAAPPAQPGSWQSLTAAQRNQFNDAWKVLAGNRTSVATSELTSLFVEVGMDADMAKLTARLYDMNGDGTIEIAEFRSFLAIGLNGTVEEKLRASFNAFDMNGDGTLSKAELKPKISTIAATVTGAPTATDDLVDEIFAMIDTDGSGTIDIEEFVAGFSKNAQVAALLTGQ